ncbi:hypothetical protein [Mesorhizobium mediterraneum]|uniref:hypothetical protein n=1 Tax=Mesorhizobium mediterraneum TaxID=43617 RepID=UPI001785017B|nr:hypothetical protein [Mesorhizobium mediterraneum]
MHKNKEQSGPPFKRGSLLGGTGHIAALPGGAKKSLRDRARERNPDEEFTSGADTIRAALVKVCQPGSQAKGKLREGTSC